MSLRNYKVIKISEGRHLLCKRRWFLCFPYDVCFEVKPGKSYSWTTNLYDAKKFMTPEEAVNKLNQLEEVVHQETKKLLKAGTIVWRGDDCRRLTTEEELTFKLGEALRHGMDHEVDALMKQIKMVK